VVKIWNYVNKQYITLGMGDVIDINICAIHDAMEICQVANREDCLDKIVYVFRKVQMSIVEE